MRFADLYLLKYGGFDDFKLLFPKQELDFHLIEGANEAGKSTAVDAVSDLLFGFQHAKSQDYRFNASLLRVAATLQDGEQEFVCQRKRGRSGSLMDMSGMAMQEGQLLSMLHGKTRDSFRLAWSLNHIQLREGGKSIVEAKDDVGQAIFAAGSGLMGISGVLRGLEEECDAIWKKRANTSSAWHIANHNLQAALQSVKANGIRPKDWVQAKEHIESLQEHRTVLDKERSKFQSEDKKLQRIRRLAGPLRRRYELEAMLDGRSTPPLSEAVENAFDAAVEALAAAQRACDTADDLLGNYREQFDALQRDPAVLSLSDEIGELLEERGAIRKALSDLPKREAELTAQQSAITELVHELHLPDRALQDLAASLPSRVSMARLRELARERERFEVTLETSRVILPRRRQKKRHWTHYCNRRKSRRA